MSEYKIKFYKNLTTRQEPVYTYLMKIGSKDRAKIEKYLEYLRVHQGYLDEPYSKHILGKIRELRVDFFLNRHRVFYFTFIKQSIVLLHAFLKKSDKTPIEEIRKALKNYQEVIKNPQLYE